MKKFLKRTCIVLFLTILLGLLLIFYINKNSKKLNIDFDPSLTLGEEGYIAEIKTESAEVFNFNTLDDNSDSVYSNLPKGTLDYCSKETLNCSDENIDKKYRLLNSGKRVYDETNDGECGLTDEYLKIYYDKLPTENKININKITESDRHTYLYLDTLWKAPFTVKLSSKNELNTEDSQTEYEYIDITFDYCTELSGEAQLFENKLFGGYANIKNENNCTLRLYLKNTGKFFGYGSYYDEGSLVIYFLNPPEIVCADNDYGYSLDNTVIMLDPGHGGSANGAKRILNGTEYCEKDINLNFSLVLAEKLRNLGAEVILTRENDIDISLYERANMVRSVKPDILISLHRNASEDTGVEGYENYYFSDYSLPLAKALSALCNPFFKINRGVKNKPAMYVTRIPECPSVLAEDGYMSNAEELTSILSQDNMDNLSDAYVMAIIEYMIYSN